MSSQQTEENEQLISGESDGIIRWMLVSNTCQYLVPSNRSDYIVVIYGDSKVKEVY